MSFFDMFKNLDESPNDDSSENNEEVIEETTSNNNEETAPENDVVENDSKMEDTVMSVEEKCEGRCHHKVNLCNDVAYNFGRNECVEHPFIPLEVAGGSRLGVVLNEGKLTYIKIVWKGEAQENLIITRNGEPIEFVSIDETDKGVKCIKLKEEVCDCDVINVIEAPQGCMVLSADDNDGPLGEFKPPCSISVIIEAEPDCDERFKREGDGLFEAYISDGTAVTIPTSWSTVVPDTVRVNTIPSYVSYDSSTGIVTLKHGVYKVDYAMTIQTQTSTSLNFSGKLLVDGVDYPSSFSADHILAGQGGDVSLAQGVTVVVPRGQTVTIELQAETDVDSSYNGNADANIIIERVKNSIDL